MEVDPIPMVLHCPHCKKQHIDEGKWATKPHRTHACVDDAAGSGCGKPFTPSARRTFGVLYADIVPELRVVDKEEAGPWRVGRKLGRTVYCDEKFVALFDEPRMAKLIVDTMNGTWNGTPT